MCEVRTESEGVRAESEGVRAESEGVRAESEGVMLEQGETEEAYLYNDRHNAVHCLLNDM